MPSTKGRHKRGKRHGDGGADRGSTDGHTEPQLRRAKPAPEPAPRRRAGRPSLSGSASASPTIGFRLTPTLRAAAVRLAAQQGMTLSELARNALTDRLAAAEWSAQRSVVTKHRPSPGKDSTPKSKLSARRAKRKGAGPERKSKPPATGAKSKH